MYESVKGKKLLVIGGDTTDTNIVRVAQAMGLYVIVVDGVKDYSNRPAKKAADEAWDINYSDTDTLVEKCLECKVDGVIAGYSEFRVLAACRIADRLGLPFYATEEQIKLTRDKRLFKDNISKYGVPVPKDFCFKYPVSEEEKAEITYPVIVKPTDYAGRKGITVCNDRSQLDAAIEYAVGKSESGNVIVEEFVEGLEFSSIYTIVDGRISLSCINEKYITDDQQKKSGLCELTLTPAGFCDQYIDKVNDNVKKFLEGISAKNGVAFFQGIVNDNGIYIFEMGYRVNGNDDWLVIEKNNGLNYLKMLIMYSLTGSMCDDISKDNPEFDSFNCTLVFYAHGGIIGTFDYSALKEQEYIEDISVLAWEGKEIAEDGTTGQKILAVKMSGETRETIKEQIKFIQNNVNVLDTEGNDMLFKPFDYNRIFD